MAAGYGRQILLVQTQGAAQSGRSAAPLVAVGQAAGGGESVGVRGSEGALAGVETLGSGWVEWEWKWEWKRRYGMSGTVRRMEGASGMMDHKIS